MMGGDTLFPEKHLLLLMWVFTFISRKTKRCASYRSWWETLRVLNCLKTYLNQVNMAEQVQ